MIFSKWCLQYDVYEVVVADKPLFDDLSQKILIKPEPVLLNDVWTLTWLVVDKTGEEISAHSKVLQNTYIKAVQSMLDAKAKEKGYDNIVSACSYAGYDNPFRAEGESYGVWRANCWQVGYRILAEAAAETRPMPTVEEVLAEMPELVLP